MPRPSRNAGTQNVPDLFDPEALLRDDDSEHNPPMDNRLVKIRDQARVVHDGTDVHAGRIPRVTDTSVMETGAMLQRRNRSEPGLKDNANSNRKLNDKIIDVSWNEVGSMGNVVVVLSAFALMAYMFSRK